jgi:hypothetical protein
MTGQIRWAVYGGIAVAVGSLVLMLAARRGGMVQPSDDGHADWTGGKSAGRSRDASSGRSGGTSQQASSTLRNPWSAQYHKGRCLCTGCGHDVQEHIMKIRHWDAGWIGRPWSETKRKVIELLAWCCVGLTMLLVDKLTGPNILLVIPLYVFLFMVPIAYYSLKKEAHRTPVSLPVTQLTQWSASTLDAVAPKPALSGGMPKPEPLLTALSPLREALWIGVKTATFFLASLFVPW